MSVRRYVVNPFVEPTTQLFEIEDIISCKRSFGNLGRNIKFVINRYAGKLE